MLKKYILFFGFFLVIVYFCTCISSFVSIQGCVVDNLLFCQRIRFELSVKFCAVPNFCLKIKNVKTTVFGYILVPVQQGQVQGPEVGVKIFVHEFFVN